VNWNLLSDLSSQALAAALRGAAARHEAIADNIANVDTPGFIRSDVRFEEALAAALQRARRAPRRAPDLFSALSLRARPDPALPARADGNNVDIDLEAVALAENTLRYHAATEALAARIRGLRTAIQRAGR
jgi:flagellar basal-body rod protein FlgB